MDPLAAAITQAGRSFTPSATPGAQVVYVVIGFDLAAADRAQLAAVASAGGGTFVEAKSGGDVARVVDEVRRKARAASAMTTGYHDAGARSPDFEEASSHQPSRPLSLLSIRARSVPSAT